MHNSTLPLMESGKIHNSIAVTTDCTTRLCLVKITVTPAGSDPDWLLQDDTTSSYQDYSCHCIGDTWSPSRPKIQTQSVKNITILPLAIISHSQSLGILCLVSDSSHS